MNWPAILAVILKYYVVVQFLTTMCSRYEFLLFFVIFKIRLQVYNIKTI